MSGQSKEDLEMGITKRKAQNADDLVDGDNVFWTMLSEDHLQTIRFCVYL
jgi:hypothetical protein